MRVCALNYTTPDKLNYELKNFDSRDEAEKLGWIVTHQGICGKCSTTKDLYVYLTRDLTRPVRRCGIEYFYSVNGIRKCISRLGFTDACT